MCSVYLFVKVSWKITLESNELVIFLHVRFTNSKIQSIIIKTNLERFNCSN